MAGYIFTPISDVLTVNESGNYGNTLIFKEVSNDYNNSPYSSTNFTAVNFSSAVKKGYYVYPLTRNASIAAGTGTTEYFDSLNEPIASATETLYPLNELDGVTVTNIEELEDAGDGKRIQVTLSHSLRAPVNGQINVEPDYFYFDRKFNSINAAKIGFDKKPPQRVLADVPLFDSATGQKLQDEFLNDLFTTEKQYFDESLLSKNASSVVLNHSEDEIVKIEEQFPIQSQVARSLLGVPRNEEQLSLFSDVSTLGLDERTWEFFSYNRPRTQYAPWEERASEDGNRFSAKLVENIREQAIELVANPVPFSYPWNESDGSLFKIDQYKKWKNFVVLGNLLYMYFEGTGRETDYLNPAEVRLGVIGNENVTLQGDQEALYQVAMNGLGISESVAFRLIDKWTESWLAIERGESTVTSSFIDTTILDLTNNIDLRTNLIERYRTLGLQQFGVDSKKRVLIDNYIQTFFNQSEPLRFSRVDANGSQPGYLDKNDTQQVILQSKEVYRYQPGRISGFTFGSRIDMDPISDSNYAEWGCVNESDEYIFRLAGSNLSIVRRSTVPLTNQSLSLSGGFDETDQTEYRNTKPIIGGTLRERYYELVIPQSRWNGDALDGNGFSGYKIDPEKVTMWKIEFSWYGAIGVQFYGYVPVGQGEARWVKLHRIIIENSLPQANLQDPYFRMRYNLVIGEKNVTTQPQFIYKYGSSVYVDGGDEGTKTVRTIESTEKNVPEDFNLPISVGSGFGNYSPNDNFVPVLSVKNKVNILNPDGVNRPSRVIGLPTNLTISTDRLVEVDVIECEAGPDGFGYTYDNGLRWNPNASPAIKTENNSPGYVFKNSFTNSGGSNLSPYASKVVDFVFEASGGTKVDRLALVKQSNVFGKRPAGPATRDKTKNFPPTFEKLSTANADGDSPFMIDETFDNAKLNVLGMNNLYIDWTATKNDPDFSSYSHTSNIDGRVLATKFKLKTKQQTADVDDDGNVAIKWIEKPVTELFNLTNTSSYFEAGKANIAVDRSSLGFLAGRSLANPKLPGYRHGFGGSLSDHNNSPSRARPSQFLYDFKEAYGGNPDDEPFTGTSEDITNSSSSSYPFRTFNNGLETYYYINRKAFKEYDVAGGGFCVPYSYAFGQTTLQRENDAVATTDAFFSGKSITCRFMNPHAAGVGIIRHPFNNNLMADGKIPQFQIGFTNRKPAKTTMDGTAQLPGENEKWNGKFESPGGTGYLNNRDYIYIEYEAHRELGSAVVGKREAGENNFRNAVKMQNDYRIKPILNEGQSSSLGYHIGGYCSSVTLEVDPSFTQFTSLLFYDTFSDFRNAFIGTNVGSDPYGDTVTVGDRLVFPDFPNAFTNDDSYTSADFSDAGVISQHEFLVLKDSDGSFATSLEEGLDIKGGKVIIEHTVGATTETFETSLTILSDPIRFKYFETDAGAINSVAYNAGQSKYAYVMQLSGQLTGSGGAAETMSDGTNITLDAGSKLNFKIVKLKYPDGNNGTEQVEKLKVFSGGTDKFWPVIRLREHAQINNINYKVERPNQAPAVISPVWKTYGATQVIRPISVNSPQGADGEVLDNTDNESNGVASSVPEAYESADRLSGIEFNATTNKILRKSISNPNFVAMPSDPAARVRFRSTNLTVYDKRGKLAEKAKKITSYYFGPDSGQGTKQSTIIPLDSTFGEDRNKLLPDQLDSKSTFFRAQAVNLDGVADEVPSAKVKLAINISEL